MLVLEEHHFYDRDIKIYTSENNYMILKNVRYQVSINDSKLINAIFLLKLHDFVFRAELLLPILLFKM
jgi:hypothetical protein